MSEKIIVEETSYSFPSGAYYVWSAKATIMRPGELPHEIDLSNMVAKSADIEGFDLMAIHKHIRHLAHDYILGATQ